MAGDGEIKVHEVTYHKVIWWLKTGAISCFLVAMLVIWLIHPTK